jgi:hypothetical protein
MYSGDGNREKLRGFAADSNAQVDNPPSHIDVGPSTDPIELTSTRVVDSADSALTHAIVDSAESIS